MEENAKYVIGREGGATDFCNKYITEALESYKRGNPVETLSKLQKALQTSQNRKDVTTQIIIYETLGTCLRFMNEDSLAWEHYSAGWLLIEKLDVNIIKSDVSFMFYAFEMLKTNIDVAKRRLVRARFDELWGENWETKIYNTTNFIY